MAKFAAAVCGIGIAGAAVGGAAAAPVHAEKRIIVNGQERPDVDRVILRENIERELPGYRLPDGSPGVLILRNGEVRPAPRGAVLDQRPRS
ncbi:hypothetical protein [Nocardia brevicatena]|uniref:hypothetical protein n=1 Tax=Nocardia brevicatena TaxID=37327 RepID=UPI0012F92176|nr:hypothetical protein [Nocardia brevicatena]